MAFFGPDVSEVVEVTVSFGVTDFFTFQTKFSFVFLTCFCLFDDTFNFESRVLKVVPSVFTIKIDETVQGEVFQSDVGLTFDSF